MISLNYTRLNLKNSETFYFYLKATLQKQHAYTLQAIIKNPEIHMLFSSNELFSTKGDLATFIAIVGPHNWGGG